MADLGPRTLAAVVRLLGDVVVAGRRLPGPVPPASGQHALELEAPLIPLPGGEEAGESSEHGIEGGPVDTARVEGLPPRKGAARDPRRDAAQGETVDGLIEAEGEEQAGLSPLDLEDLLDAVDHMEVPGRRVEGREGSDGEGGMKGVDPDRRRGEDATAGITRAQVTQRALADLAELGVPVGFPLVEVLAMPLAIDFPEHHIPRITGHIASRSTCRWNRTGTARIRRSEEGPVPYTA